MSKTNQSTPRMDRSSSGAFWSTASEFYHAALLVNRKKPREMLYQMVDYYLICHSIEASLKGFLRGKGYTIKRLRDVGHDLEKALKCARDEGIEGHCQFSTDFLTDLTRANFYYKVKDFEYLLAGVVQLPKKSDLLLDGAGMLVDKLRRFCIDKMQEHYNKESAHDPAFEEWRNRE